MAALIRYVDRDGDHWIARPEAPRGLLRCVAPTATDEEALRDLDARATPTTERAFRVIEALFGLRRLHPEEA